MKNMKATINTTTIKHHTSSVLIFTDKAPVKTLLLHHKKHDRWMPPGGHQEKHDNQIETAIREVKEETGIDITSYFSPIKRIDAQALLLPIPNYLLEEIVKSRLDEPEHVHLDSIYVVRLPEQSVNNRIEESNGIQ